ncbi:hypothetical protein Ais01nite_74620 [Asanoa ishikariensis]|nr:hypothetical protein [Asanoa ishikariensis]GIF69427.1 hypothetical protein Ais01nite_74620 [Asanoa ishikariensis]
MRTVWTTDLGPDPALRQTFAADQPSAVAPAVVGGADVLVTLAEEHEDFDCHLGVLHHERCPEPGMRIWDRATGTLIRAVPDVCDNGTGYPAVLVTVVVDGRPLAVVRDWARPRPGDTSSSPCRSIPTPSGVANRDTSSTAQSTAWESAASWNVLATGMA